MNVITHGFRLAAAMAAMTVLGVTPLLAAVAKPPLQTADLQVLIDVPPTWRPFLDEDIAEALGSRLIDTFKKRGFTGRIEQLKPGEAPAPGVPQLEIRLIEWRIGRSGSADCTLQATARTANGSKDLGLITNSAIFWPHDSGHWGLNRAYETAGALEDAAEHAMRDLYLRLVRGDILPGLTVKP